MMGGLKNTVPIIGCT